jgi:argininosuccinate synthase
MAREKVVLAYSGGLDTSVCIKWLIDEKDLDVIAMVGDVGQDHDGLEEVRKKALSTGAVAAYVVDMREEFCNEFLDKALAANALYENKYPLLSALSRPIIVKHLVEIAQKHDARYIAHGCTGKGNDQVRFEVGIHALAPDIEIIAPVREWDLHTRDEEMDWALAHGVPVPTTKSKPYSIDDNLWGKAIECGVLEDPWNLPPADIYTMTTAPEEAPDQPEIVVVGFSHGLPCSIDGKEMSYHEAILAMNVIAGRNGYGRIDMIENRLVGIKARECYETPGALALICAHKALEDMTLEREVLHYKLKLEQDWATLVYNGLWYSPLKNAFDAFFASTQAAVTGEIRLSFYKGSCTVTGRRSDYSLYDYSLATYDAADQFNHAAAAGFIELHGLPTRVWARQKTAE